MFKLDEVEIVLNKIKYEKIICEIEYNQGLSVYDKLFIKYAINNGAVVGEIHGCYTYDLFNDSVNFFEEMPHTNITSQFI